MEESANNLSKQRRRRRILMHSDDEDDGTPSKIQSLLQSEPTFTMLSEQQSSPLTEHTVSSFSSTEKSESTSVTKKTFSSSSQVGKQETSYESFSKSESSKVESYSDFTKTESSYSSYRRTDESSSVKKSYSSSSGLPDNLPGFRNIGGTKGTSRNLEEAEEIESSHLKLSQNGKNEDTSSSFGSYHDFGKINRDDRDVSIVDTGKSRTYHETSVKEEHSETFDKNANEKRRFRTDLEKYSYSDKENTRIDYKRSEHHEVIERRGFVAPKDILDKSHHSRDTRDGKHVQHSVFYNPADHSLPLETHAILDELPSGNLEKPISRNTEEEKTPNVSHNVQSYQQGDVSEIHVASIRDRVRLMRASMANRFYEPEDDQSDDEAVTDIRFSSDDETDGLAKENQTVTAQEQPEQFTVTSELADDVTLFEQNTAPVTTSLKRDHGETQPFDLQTSKKLMKREIEDELSETAHVERLPEEASTENLLVQSDSDKESNIEFTEEGILDLEERPILTHKADELTQQDLANIVHAQVSTINEFTEQGVRSEEIHLAETDATDIKGGNQIEAYSTNGVYSVPTYTDVKKSEQNKNEYSDNDWSTQEGNAMQLIKIDKNTPETADLEGDMITETTQLSEVEIVTENRPNKLEPQHETPATSINADESFTETGRSKYSDEIQLMETNIFEIKTMPIETGEIQSMEKKTGLERPETDIDSGNNLSQQLTSKFTSETATDISGVHILPQGSEDEVHLTDSNVKDEPPAMEVGVNMTPQAIASKTEPMVDDNALQDPQKSQHLFANEDYIQQDDQTRLQAVSELNDKEDRITLKDNKKAGSEIAIPPSDFIDPPTNVGSAAMDTDLNNNSGDATETEVLIKPGELTTDSSQSKKLEHPQGMVGSDEVIIIHGNAINEPNVGNMIKPSHDKPSYEVEKHEIRTYESQTYEMIETSPNEQTSPEKQSPEVGKTLSYEVKRHEVRPTETTFSKSTSSKKLDLRSYAPRPYKKVEQKTQHYQVKPRVKQPNGKPTFETERQEMRFYHLKSIEQRQAIQPPTKTEDDKKTYESSTQERSDDTSLHIKKLTEIQSKKKLEAGKPYETSTQKGPEQLTLYDSQAMDVWLKDKRQDETLGKLHPTASYRVESHEIRSFEPMALESQPNEQRPSLLESPTNLPAEVPPQSKSEGIRQPQDPSGNDEKSRKLNPYDPHMTAVTSPYKMDETEDNLFHADRYDNATREIKSFKTTFSEFVPHDVQHSETQYNETKDNKKQSGDKNVQLPELQCVETQDAKVESKEGKDVEPEDDLQHTYNMKSRTKTSYKTTLHESPAHNASLSKEISPERDLRYASSKVRAMEYTSYESAVRELQPNDVQLPYKQPYGEQPHEPQTYTLEIDESSRVDSLDGVQQYDDQTQDILKQKKILNKRHGYEELSHSTQVHKSSPNTVSSMEQGKTKNEPHDVDPKHLLQFQPNESSGPMENVPDHETMSQQEIPDEVGLQYTERIEPPTVHTPEIRLLDASLNPTASDLEPELIDEHKSYASQSSYAITNPEAKETAPVRYSLHTSTEHRRHYRDTSSPVLQRGREEFEYKKREYVASDDEVSFATYEPILVLRDLPEDTNAAVDDYGPLKDEDTFSHQNNTQLDSSPRIQKRKYPEETEEDESDWPEHVAIKRKIRVVTSNQQETRRARSSYSNKTTFGITVKENITPTSQHTTSTNAVTEDISSSTRNALESSNEPMDNIFNMMENQGIDSQEQLPGRLPQSLEKYPCDTEVEKFAKPTDPLRKYRVDFHIQLSPVEGFDSKTKALKSWKSEPILNVGRPKERRSKSMDLDKKLPMQSSVAIELKKPQRRPLVPAYAIENLPFETIIRNEVSIKLKKKRRNTIPSEKIKGETHDIQLSDIAMKEIERRDVQLSESFDTVDAFYAEYFSDEDEDNNKENQSGDDVAMENADESPLIRRNDESVSVDQKPRTSQLNVAPITIRPKTIKEQPTYVEVKQGHGSDITFGRIESVSRYKVHHAITSEKPRDDIIIEETSLESAGFSKRQTREDGTFKEEISDHSKEDFVEPKDEDQHQGDEVLQGHASIRDQAELSRLYTLGKPNKSTNRRQRVVIDRKLLEEAVKHEEPILPTKENLSLEHEPDSPNENRSVEHAVNVEKYLDNDSNNNAAKELQQQYLLNHPKRGRSHSEEQDEPKEPQDFFEDLDEFKPSLGTEDGRTHYDKIYGLPSNPESVSSINISKYLENVVENKVEDKSEIDGVVELEPYEPYEANKEIQMLMEKISSDEEEPVKPLVPQQAIEVILIDETKKKKKKKAKKQTDSGVDVISDLVDKRADDHSTTMGKPTSVETKPKKKDQVNTKEIAVQTMFLPEDMDSEDDSDLEILQYLPRSFINTIPEELEDDDSVHSTSDHYKFLPINQERHNRGLLVRNTQDHEPTHIHPHQKKPAITEPAKRTNEATLAKFSPYITDSQLSQEKEKFETLKIDTNQHEKDVTTTISHTSFTIENFLSENSDEKDKPWPTEISGAEHDVPRSIYSHQPEDDKVGFEFDSPTESRESSPNSTKEYETSKVTYKPRCNVQDFVQEDQRRQNGGVVHAPPIKKHRMSSPHSPTNNTVLESSEYRKKEPIVISKPLEVPESAKPSHEHSYELHAFIKKEVQDGYEPNQPTRTKVSEEEARQGENRLPDRDMEVDSGLEVLTAYEPRYNRRPNKPKRTTVPPLPLIKNVSNEHQEKESKATLPEYAPEYEVGYFKTEEQPTMGRFTDEPNSCTDHPAKKTKNEITRPKYEARPELIDLISKEDKKIKERPSDLVPVQKMETPTVPVVHNIPEKLASRTLTNQLNVFAPEEKPEVKFPQADSSPNNQLTVSLLEVPERQPIYATRNSKSLDLLEASMYTDALKSSFYQPQNEIKNFVLQEEPSAVDENDDSEKLKTEEYHKELEPDHKIPSIKDNVFDNEPSCENVPFLRDSMIETHRTPQVEEETQQTKKVYEPRSEIRAFVVEEEPKTMVNGMPTLPHKTTATMPAPAESSYEPKHWIKNFVEEKLEDNKEPRNAIYDTQINVTAEKEVQKDHKVYQSIHQQKSESENLVSEESGSEHDTEPSRLEDEREEYSSKTVEIKSFVRDEHQLNQKTTKETTTVAEVHEDPDVPQSPRQLKHEIRHVIADKYKIRDVAVGKYQVNIAARNNALATNEKVDTVQDPTIAEVPERTYIVSQSRKIQEFVLKEEPEGKNKPQIQTTNTRTTISVVHEEPDGPQSINQRKHELRDFVFNKYPANKVTENKASAINESVSIVKDRKIKEPPEPVFTISQPIKIKEIVLEEEVEPKDKPQTPESDENLTTTTINEVHKEPELTRSYFEPTYEIDDFMFNGEPSIGRQFTPLPVQKVEVTVQTMVEEQPINEMKNSVLDEKTKTTTPQGEVKLHEPGFTRTVYRPEFDIPDLEEPEVITQSVYKTTYEINDLESNDKPVSKPEHKPSTFVLIQEPKNTADDYPVSVMQERSMDKPGKPPTYGEHDTHLKKDSRRADLQNSPVINMKIGTQTNLEVEEKAKFKLNKHEISYFGTEDRPEFIAPKDTSVRGHEEQVQPSYFQLKYKPTTFVLIEETGKYEKTAKPFNENDFEITTVCLVEQEPESSPGAPHQSQFEKPVKHETEPQESSTISVPFLEQVRPSEGSVDADEGELTDDISLDEDEELTRLDIDPYPSSRAVNLHRPTTFSAAGALALEDSTDGPTKLLVDFVNEDDETKLSLGYEGPADLPAVNIPETATEEHDVEQEPVVVNFIDYTPKQIEKKEVRDSGVLATTTEDEKTKKKSVLISPTQTRATIAVVLVDNEQDHVTKNTAETSVAGMPSQLIKQSSLREAEHQTTTVKKTEEKDDEPNIKRVDNAGKFTTVDEISELTDESSQGENDELTRLDIDTSVEGSANVGTDFLNTSRTWSYKRGIQKQTTVIIEEECTRETKGSPIQSFDKAKNRPQTEDQNEPDNFDHATNFQLYSPEAEAHLYQKGERETVVETSPVLENGYNYFETTTRLEKSTYDFDKKDMKVIEKKDTENKKNILAINTAETELERMSKTIKDEIPENMSERATKSEERRVKTEHDETIEIKTPDELNEERTEFWRTDSQHERQKTGESVSMPSPQKTGRITVVLLDDESEQNTKENTNTLVPLVEQARYDEIPHALFELTDQSSEEEEELTRLDFDPYPLIHDERVHQPLVFDVEDTQKLENSYASTDTTDGSRKAAIDLVNEDDKTTKELMDISAVSIPETATAEHDVEQEPVEVNFVENTPEQIAKQEVRNFDISTTKESNQKMNESVSKPQLRATERIAVVLANDDKDLVTTNIAEASAVGMQSQLIKKRSLREVETLATTLGKTEAAPEITPLRDGDMKYTMNNARFDEADDYRGTKTFVLNGRPVQIDPDEPSFTGTAVIERIVDGHHTETKNRAIHTTTYTSIKPKIYESDGKTAVKNVPEVAEQKFIRDSYAPTLTVDDKPRSVDGKVSLNVMQNSENAIVYEHQEDEETNTGHTTFSTYHSDAENGTISSYVRQLDPQAVVIVETAAKEQNTSMSSASKEYYELEIPESTSETVKPKHITEEDIYARVNKEKLRTSEQSEETLKRQVKASGNHVCIDHQPGAKTIAVAEENLTPDLEEKTVVKDIKMMEDNSEVRKQKFIRNTETQRLEHPPKSEDVVWMTVRHSKKLFNSGDSVRMITLPIVNTLPSYELSPTDDTDLDWLTEQPTGEASREFGESTYIMGKEGGESSSSNRFIEESLLVQERGKDPKHESMGRELLESTDTKSEQKGLSSRIITEEIVSNEKKVVEDTENIATKRSVREVERSPDQYMIDENETESWIRVKGGMSRTSSLSKGATSEDILSASQSQVVENEKISQQSGKETVIDNMTSNNDVWCTVKMRRWESDIRKENWSKRLRGTESVSELSTSTASVDGSYGRDSRAQSPNSEFSMQSEQSARDPWISVRRKRQNIGDASTLSIKSSTNGKIVERSCSSGRTDRGGSIGHSIQITATNDGPLISQDDTLSSTYSHEVESSQGTDVASMTTLPWIEVRQRNSIKHRLSLKKKKGDGTLKGVPHTTNGKDRLLLIKIPQTLLMEIENDENVLETEVEIPWMELDPSSAGEIQSYLPWVELADQVQNTQSDRILMLKISREMILKASQSSANEESEIQLPWNEVVKYWEETGQIPPGSLAQGEKAANIAITFPSQSESEILEENLNLPDMRLILPKKYCLDNSLRFKPTITVNEKRNIKVRINKSMKRKHDWNTLLRLSKAERRKKYSYVTEEDEWVALADGTKWWRLHVDDMDEFSQVRPRSDGENFKNYFEISSEETDGKESIDFNEFTKELGIKKQKQFSFVIDPKNLLTSTMSF